MVGRLLSALTTVIGLGASIWAGIAIFQHGLTPMDLLLVILALPAVWLQVKLEPVGHITLMPIVVFVSFAVAAQFVPVLVAVAAGSFGALFFQRLNIGDAIQATGEEVTPVLVAMALSSLSLVEALRYPWPTKVVLAVFGYVVGWLAVAVLKANAKGVGLRSVLSGVGRSIGFNFLFFCIVALGLAYLVRQYGDSGYFTLALAMVALVEAFHPYKLLSDQRDVLFASLTMFAQAIDLKDGYTGEHVRHTSEVAVRIARKLGLSEVEIWNVRFAGILHDIGKVGISGKIIRKPSKLDPEEMAAMRKHPVKGAEIMQPVRLLADAAEIVRHHHEHFDGSGYPDGLKGDQIPLGSRIVLVADAFDAITTKRSYRQARSKDEALKILRANAGKQFDSAVVSALESIAAYL